METKDGIQLIKHEVLTAKRPTQWADLGCGTGFFTNVLSSFLAEGSTIYAADSNVSALAKVKVAQGVNLQTFALDIVTQQWPFDKLDGILIANALHYVRGKDAFITKARKHLVERGTLLIVEYDMDTPNTWVPYPITFNALEALCGRHGFATVEKINQMPSVFGRANMYAAIAGL